VSSRSRAWQSQSTTPVIKRAAAACSIAGAMGGQVARGIRCWPGQYASHTVVASRSSGSLVSGGRGSAHWTHVQRSCHSRKAVTMHDVTVTQSPSALRSYGSMYSVTLREHMGRQGLQLSVFRCMLVFKLPHLLSDPSAAIKGCSPKCSGTDGRVGWVHPDSVITPACNLHG
jgi:hypothetical protein